MIRQPTAWLGSVNEVLVVPLRSGVDGEVFPAHVVVALGELSANGEIDFHMSVIGMAAEVQLLHSADQGSFDLGL